ncbi:MAG: hypothetical protein JW818_05425 [Pirellulales bacterium]|nr:hypothetical protein [Pirellulales bacterium]
MARRHGESMDRTGQDSFLDIVTNIVAVLIILVLVVSVRARRAPVTLSIDAPANATSNKKLEQDRATEATLNDLVWQEAAKIRNIDLAFRSSNARRQELDRAVLLVEKELARRRGELNAQAQADFDRRRNQAEADARLAELRRQRERLAQSVVKPVRVEHYPTPLSRTVDGQEIHVHLSGDRVAIVPLDALLHDTEEAIRQKVARLQQVGELVDQTAPRDGFRLRYTVRRFEMLVRNEGGGRSLQSGVRLELIEVLPVSHPVGEPIDAALAEGSDFYRKIAASDPARTTVTIWTYPDSFDAFRRMKEWLLRRGFLTAARLRDQGELITGSPDGSRSAAQ